MTKQKPVITVANYCRDLIVIYKHTYNCKINLFNCVGGRDQYINNICVSYVTPCHYICTTDANRPEKKDKLLNPMYTAWLNFLYNTYSYVVVINYG